MNHIIGIDFDNTIVCYNEVFHEVAVERDLIASDFPKNKEKIRNFLRKIDKEDEWTELQGYVYGKRMASARPFPGALEFIHAALNAGIKIYIISHKTQHPYAGPKYDLHAAATEWLEINNVFSKQHIGLDVDCVHFIETKQGKCEKIASNNCTHFIDDLPELLLDNAFPATAKKMLFSPEEQVITKQIDNVDALTTFTSWAEINRYFFNSDSR